MDRNEMKEGREREEEGPGIDGGLGCVYRIFSFFLWPSLETSFRSVTHLVVPVPYGFFVLGVSPDRCVS